MRVYNSHIISLLVYAIWSTISLSLSLCLCLSLVTSNDWRRSADRPNDVDEAFGDGSIICAGYFKSLCRGPMVAQWFRNDGYRSYTGGLWLQLRSHHKQAFVHTLKALADEPAYRAYYNCTASITCPIYGTNHGHTRTARRRNMQYYCIRPVMISLLSDHIGVNPESIWLERFYPLNEARTMGRFTNKRRDKVE